VRTYNRSIELLLLCTANQCRSPMAEVLLRHRLEAAGADVRVSSAGLHQGGRPATDHGLAAMADRGLDLSAHVSRQLDRDLVARADLIIGMAREHVREVVVLDRNALARTFTLKELVRDGTAVGPRLDGEALGDWLARVAVNRRPATLLGVGHDDAYDIADPVGRGRADYEVTAKELDHLVALLVEMGWPAQAGHGRERSA
jgi:protein-tyrosine phosphatase